MLEIAPLAKSGADLAVGTKPHIGAIIGRPVTLSPAAPHSRWSLRARDPALLGSALGRALPDRIGTVLDGIARLGPDEWYALLEAGTALPVLTGLPVSVVDVSARALGFTVSGEGARLALERGCPLDLARLAPGSATRTVFETVEIQVWPTAPDAFHIEVWRSFAPWLWHALAEAIV